jgi:hypothetical protein
MLGMLLQVQPVSVSDSFKDTFNFLQGNGVYEDGIMHFLQAMKASIWGQYDTFIADAQALAAIFMIRGQATGNHATASAFRISDGYPLVGNIYQSSGLSD